MATKNNPQQPKPSTVGQQATKPQSKGQGAVSQPQPNQTGAFIQQFGRRSVITEEYDDTGKLSKVTREIPAKKTLWDLSQLVIIPLILLLLGFYFTYQQNQTSLNMSNSQHATDNQIAQEQQHEALLQGYLDHMSDLLLTGHLHDSKPGDEIRAVARARTLETLFRLDPDRREAVLGFLFEAGLIGVSVGRDNSGQSTYNPIPTIVYLNGADLTKANNLDGHILEKADLSSTYLSESNMSRADLYKTNLHGAVLENTNLTGAILIDADLSGASVEGTIMNDQTILSGTNLQGAKYNTKPKQVKDAQGNLLTLEPTQWPQGFDPKAAGAICIDC